MDTLVVDKTGRSPWASPSSSACIRRWIHRARALIVAMSLERGATHPLARCD
jgi:hypothetical protein